MLLKKKNPAPFSFTYIILGPGSGSPHGSGHGSGPGTPVHVPMGPSSHPGSVPMGPSSHPGKRIHSFYFVILV